MRGLWKDAAARTSITDSKRAIGADVSSAEPDINRSTRFLQLDVLTAGIELLDLKKAARDHLLILRCIVDRLKGLPLLSHLPDASIVPLSRSYESTTSWP
jgi:hypothetical protein